MKNLFNIGVLSVLSLSLMSFNHDPVGDTLSHRLPASFDILSMDSEFVLRDLAPGSSISLYLLPDVEFSGEEAIDRDYFVVEVNGIEKTRYKIPVEKNYDFKSRMLWDTTIFNSYYLSWGPGKNEERTRQRSQNAAKTSRDRYHTVASGPKTIQRPQDHPKRPQDGA